MWFPFPSELSPFAGISDAAITHYPNAIFLLRSIFDHGQIPLWSPALFSGYPFAANPLSGLWYPPGWFALLFPLPLGFNLAVLLHLALGSLGAYSMLRDMGRSEQASLFGAIAFAGMPQIFAHYGAGHLTFVYALCWTPWMILTERRRQSGTGNFWLRQPGIVLALIALAHPQWAVFIAGLWFAYLVTSKPSDRKISGFGVQVLLAVGLASPLLFPFTEYVSLSSRAGMASHEVLQYSLPPQHLLGLIVPTPGIFHEWMIYAGAPIFIFAMLGLLVANGGMQKWFWAGTLLVSLVMALGSSIPFAEAAASLPIASLLRVPSRILPLYGFALVILAAHGFDAVRSGVSNRRKINLGFFAISTGMVAACLIVSAIIGLQVVIVIAALAALTTGITMLFLSTRLGERSAGLLVSAILVVELAFLNHSLVTFKPAQEILSQGEAVTAFLSAQDPPFRVFSPTQSISQQTAALQGLELVNGTDPLHLAVYDEFIGAVVRAEVGYSVNVPERWDAVFVDLPKLAMLNTKYIVSPLELDQAELNLVWGQDEIYVYKLSQDLPRAYISGKPDEVVGLDWSPNKISIQANGPGRLILSEINYPGWVVEVDDTAAQLETYAGMLRSVELDDGLHEVNFVYKPISVYSGLGTAVSAIVILLWMWLFEKSKSSRKDATTK